MIADRGLLTIHFKGKAWNKGMKTGHYRQAPLEELLVSDSKCQTYKLKLRLFEVGIKCQACEQCGWSECAQDGRIPVELDHINGDRHDNRLENLRILCPNCHSLQPTHRGKNRRKNPPGRVV
jgi:hypothetical protein